MSLYKISAELRQLDFLEGDNEETRSILIDQLTRKTDGCVDYLRQLEDEILLAKNRALELKEMIDRKKRQVENVKKYIQESLELSGKDKFEGELNVIKKKKPSYSTNVTNADLVPSEFKETVETIKVDKTTIKKRLLEGELIEGVELVESKINLNIRLK